MNDNNKKYRRSALSIVCYVLAALMVLFIIYTAGSTVAQINQYYAQYDMKAQPMEYVTYIMQAVLAHIVNAFLFFMMGYILDEVRKNNAAYYLSDEEIEEAKIAKKEAREAKKAAAAEAAAAKTADIATTEQSVEADFAKSLDEELSKEAEKKAPKQKSNNGQKCSFQQSTGTWMWFFLTLALRNMFQLKRLCQAWISPRLIIAPKNG